MLKLSNTPATSMKTGISFAMFLKFCVQEVDERIVFWSPARQHQPKNPIMIDIIIHALAPPILESPVYN